MVPKTADGRVLFAVPWLGKVILGTTDTPRDDLAREPDAFAAEIEFILSEAARYLQRAPTRADVKSIWVGLRPLVKPLSDRGDHGDASKSTKKVSREHTILVSKSGLVTVTGGKWTTYRAMAEDVLAHCFDAKLLPFATEGVTVNLPLVGAAETATDTHAVSAPPGLHSYGTDGATISTLPGADHEIAWGLTEAMVRFAARAEYARTVEDVLARRSRLLFLDARLALKVAPTVAAILQEETGLDPQLAAFEAMAQRYVLQN